MKTRIIQRSTGDTLLTINDPSSGSYITGKLAGLGLPAVRVTRGSYSGRPGGFSGKPEWEPRLITIDGLLIADEVPLMQDRRRSFLAAFSGLEGVELHIDYENGKSYLIYAELIGTPELDYVPLDPLRAPFALEFLANDPIIYDNTTGLTELVPLGRREGGGFTYPIVYPIVYDPGGQPVNVPNTGDVEIFPVITLHGVATNPVITNFSTGESFALLNIKTASYDVLTLDMNGPSVQLNGGNIYDAVAYQSNWLYLRRGDNFIALDTASDDDTVSGNISWRNGVLGI